MPTTDRRALDISELELSTIQDEVRAALRSGFGRRALELFLVGVDWSRMADADPVVRETLGKLENLMAEYADGGLEEREALVELLQILPADERSTRLTTQSWPELSVTPDFIRSPATPLGDPQPLRIESDRPDFLAIA